MGGEGRWGRWGRWGVGGGGGGEHTEMFARNKINKKNIMRAILEYVYSTINSTTGKYCSAAFIFHISSSGTRD